MKGSIVPFLDVELGCFPSQSDREISLYDMRCRLERWHGIFLVKAKREPISQFTYRLNGPHQGNWYVGRIVSNEYAMSRNLTFDVSIQMGPNVAEAYYATDDMFKRFVNIFNVYGEDLFIDSKEDINSDFLMASSDIITNLGLIP